MPISASNTSTGKRPLPSSTPFEQMITGKSASTASASVQATSRMRFDGVTMTAAAAPASASSYEVEATMFSDRATSLR